MLPHENTREAALILRWRNTGEGSQRRSDVQVVSRQAIEGAALQISSSSCFSRSNWNGFRCVNDNDPNPLIIPITYEASDCDVEEFCFFSVGGQKTFLFWISEKKLIKCRIGKSLTVTSVLLCDLPFSAGWPVSVSHNWTQMGHKLSLTAMSLIFNSVNYSVLRTMDNFWNRTKCKYAYINLEELQVFL